jgi:hypothetical protein
MTNTTSPIRSIRSVRRASLAVVVAAGLFAGCGGGADRAADTPTPSAPDTTTTEPPTRSTAGDLDFVVDAGVGDPDHPDRGVLVFEGGDTETVVVDQLAVVADDRSDFDAFLDRWPVAVVEEDASAGDGSIEALVALDGETDSSTLTTDLSALQPWLGGTVTASDPRLLTLYTIVAAEGVRGDVLVVPNDIVTGNVEPWEAIEDGRSTEGTPSADDSDATLLGPDPFQWPYLADGTTQDFGVVGAWTILEGTGRFERRVNIVVHDGGFAGTFDYGGDAEMRHGTWGEENGMGCGPDNPCPWHGTGVAQTALGHVDDWTGVVGTAGPIGRLFAVESATPSAWKQLRNLRNVAKGDAADVVNMSWGNQSTTVPGIRTDYYDRYFKAIRKSNVLLVAAAGNDGRNVDAGACGNGCDETRLFMPCESTVVLCVGGVAHDSVDRANGSNYGTVDDDASVEIFGPMRVVVSSIDTSGGGAVLGDNVMTGGTSFSSPFVAGIAALLYSADGDMTPDRATELLLDTARPVVSDVDMRAGSRRLVNAREAVLELLDMELDAPTVEFATPTDDEIVAPDGLIGIRPVAEDMFGNPLWTQVEASGFHLGFVRPGDFVATTLAPGHHQIVAHATDRFGQTTTTTIEVEVPEVPARLEIVGVADGETIDGGSALALVGRGRDGVMFQPIPTDGFAWGLVDPDGDLIGIAEGEQATFDLPNVAGEYSVVLDHNDVVADEVVVTFEVRQTDPNFTPQIVIDTPDQGDWFAVDALSEADVDYAGRAFDDDGAPIPAERLRWTARASNGERRTLCEGTSYSAGVDDIVSEIVRCDSGTATLKTVATAGQNTWWRLTLEVIDPESGAIASTSTIVYLEYIAS